MQATDTVRAVFFPQKRAESKSSSAHVLIVDDDNIFCLSIEHMVHEHGYSATICHSLGDCLKEIKRRNFDLVFLDVHLPDGNGLSIVHTLRKMPSPPEIIIMTSATNHKGASKAIRDGAWDYLVKGESIRSVQLSFLRALERHARICRSRSPLKLNGIAGNGPRISECIHQLEEAAWSDANVLITGETGTGKELFARAVHDNSFRSDKPFVVVDCAALHHSVMASDLFGYTKGAFTGALTDKVGLIERANGGTLFLDEVSELTMEMQKSFLRVLESRHFRPVGSSRERESDFRLVCACNRNLKSMAMQGGFRKDLYYRLTAISIELPPLRERREDIPAIAEQHLRRLRERYGLSRQILSKEILSMFMHYEWPGNVRELTHVLEGLSVVATSDEIILPTHLPRSLLMTFMGNMEDAGFEESGAGDVTEADISPDLKWKDYRQEMLKVIEYKYIKSLMHRCGGNVQLATSCSGLSQTRLYELIKKHAL